FYTGTDGTSEYNKDIRVTCLSRYFSEFLTPSFCHIVNASGDFCCQFFHPYRVTLIILNKTKYPEYIYFLLVPET
ncbi:hypothetical protein, partial [Escherichia coli]|uniref:hypothetical protein n=2 Tax=Escherichia coli TaxID=562 RepID=UPI001BDDB165